MGLIKSVKPHRCAQNKKEMDTCSWPFFFFFLFVEISSFNNTYPSSLKNSTYSVYKYRIAFVSFAHCMCISLIFTGHKHKPLDFLDSSSLGSTNNCSFHVMLIGCHLSLWFLELFVVLGKN